MAHEVDPLVEIGGQGGPLGIDRQLRLTTFNLSKDFAFFILGDFRLFKRIRITPLKYLNILVPIVKIRG
jgi:hypothetical protein